MKLQISHQTNYYYDELAQRSVQYIRITPMQMPHQTIHKWDVMLPKVATNQRDGFGNAWLTLSRNRRPYARRAQVPYLDNLAQSPHTHVSLG